MPRLSAKHQNQQAVVLGDFTGGLNTAAAEEFIGDNQLAEVVNMEADVISKKLSTVMGTIDVYRNDDKEFVFTFWDNINQQLILCDDGGTLYTGDENFENIEEIGDIEGDPKDLSAANWERGVLLAGGRHLNYFYQEGEKPEEVKKFLKVIKTSPEHCRCVFIRSGRVIVINDGDELLFSAVGREGLREDGSDDIETVDGQEVTAWTQDPNDPSAALFAEIGYKAGGKLISACPSSTDILLMKDNGLCYKLNGEYPDWKISEVSRELYCKNVNGSCSLGTGKALVLGNGILSAVDTTQEYGDMKPAQMGQQIPMQIAQLPENTKLRYIASLNQVWFITNSPYVLVYSVDTNSFYQRWFNSTVKEVVGVNQKTYILKDNAVSVLDFNGGKLEDNGQPLVFKARFRTELSSRQVLVKTESVSVTPWVKEYDRPDVTFHIAKVNIPFPRKKIDDELVQTIGPTQFGKEPASYGEIDESYFQRKTVTTRLRQLYRGDRVRISLEGKGFPFTLNYITYEKVEV